MSPRKQQAPNLACSFRVEAQLGLSNILGLDEVGRGCLAGPVYAALVRFDQASWNFSEESPMALINDSKKLSAKRRESLYNFILESASYVGVKSISPTRIDKINILQASFEAFRQLLDEYTEREGFPDVVLLDGHQKIPNLKLKQHCIVGGDSVSKSIAAASIVAKVERDRWMIEASEKYPAYGFERNKGYGTREHWKALEEQGPCSIHRRSFLSRLDERKKGAACEKRVADYLLSEGFQVLERNYRLGRYELDLIATREKKLHIVEVRSRDDKNSELAFPKAKQEKIRKARQLLFRKRPDLEAYNSQVDLFVVGEDSMRAHWNVYAW